MGIIRSWHEPLQKGEYFVGNINVDMQQSSLKKLDKKGIQYRIGTTAYDIEGAKIEQANIKPLILIGRGSYDAYNAMQERELKKIMKSGR